MLHIGRYFHPSRLDRSCSNRPFRVDSSRECCLEVDHLMRSNGQDTDRHCENGPPTKDIAKSSRVGRL
jgi:hypothetical protein